jgi:hypothetical protein
MIDKTDEDVAGRRIVKSNLNLSFDELIQLKAQNQTELTLRRNAWAAEANAMSPAERIEAQERFEQAFTKIASQFGRSKRLVMPPKPASEEPI